MWVEEGGGGGGGGRWWCWIALNDQGNIDFPNTFHESDDPIIRISELTASETVLQIRVLVSCVLFLCKV